MTLRSFFGAPLRALRGMSFSRTAARLFFLPRSRVDYRREVGNGLGSSTVAAPVQWVAKTFPEAPPALWEKLGRGQEEQVDDHPLLRLLERPNPYHTGPVQWMATTTDWLVDGNVYWMKIRSRANTPIELWWVPSWMIDAKGKDNDGSVYIDHYEYRPEGYDPIRVPPEDVVHFRFGLDPDDPRKGYSPLKSVLREVFTDDEAAAFTASLLRNMGVPGLLVAPDSDAEIQPGDAE